VAGELLFRLPQVREVQFWVLGFSRNPAKDYAVENLAGGLKTETPRYELPVDAGSQNGNPGLFVRAGMTSSSGPAPSRGQYTAREIQVDATA
jgi:hypothetical protein